MKKNAFERPLISLAVAACFAGAVHANPTAPTVVSGSATFATSGKTLTVTNVPGTIINWQQFSIRPDEVTRFVQSGAASAVLNRVTGGDPSAILGQLLSNGRVFLINPSGVVVGAGARIDTAGFVASSLNLSNEDFLAGRFRFTDPGNAGKVTNAGTIHAHSGGPVYLIAPTVENHGVITAPNGDIILAAGKSVELVSAASPHLRVQLAAGGEALNVGQLIAESGFAGIYGAAIRNSGTVSADSASVNAAGNVVLKASRDVTLEATSVVSANGARGGAVHVQAEGGTLLADGRVDAKGALEKGGEVTLLGERVGLVGNAAVDASGATGGGTVLVGGDYQGKNAEVQNAARTLVASGAHVAADAIERGEGGRVVVWSDGATRYDGAISARGGAGGGDGGFVEVSGKETLGFGGAVDTSAAQGASGILLLDPTNINVVAGPTPNPPNAADGLWAFGEDPGTQSIGAGAINTLLTANNLTLQATNNITVGAAISYTGAADRTLTLQANNNVTVSQSISATATAGRLGVVLNADADASGAGNVAINNAITTRGGALVATGQNVTANATGTTISTVGTTGRAGGNVTLAAAPTGAVTLSKAIAASGGAAAAGSNGHAGGNVSISGGTVSVTNVTAAGSAGVGPGARNGGAGGTITLDATGAAPAITLGGNLDARGGNGVGGGVGGAGGAITALDPISLTGNRQVLSAGGTGGTPAGGAVQLGPVNSNVATARRQLTVTAGNAVVTLGDLGATNALGTVNVSGVGITAGSVRTVGLANGAGANVTLNAGSGALVVGAIDTSAGARTSSGSGSNGGSVTLTGNTTTAGAITTRGAHALGPGNFVGGNGGAVVMNGTGTASSISLIGAIDTRGGNSVGTGNTGNGGAVTLRATDGGSITGTAAATINTSGGRGQAGANVLVTQQAAGQTVATVDLAGAITTSGGNGGTNAAGRNAGTVTVANTRTIALGAITARGGDSGGANSVGGNGGAVSITRAGTASTMAFNGMIDTRGGNSTGTGNAGNGGAVTIDAGAAPNVGTVAFAAGAGIDTRGGRGQTGGNVIIRDASSVAFDPTASIDTSGGTGVTTGKNAGTVTMTAGITGPVTLGAVTTRGSAAVAANSAGGNGGNVAVTSVGATLAGAIDTRGGDGTGTAVGGTSGTITVNGGAGAVTSTAAGTLTTRGARGSNGGNVTLSTTAAGSISLNGAIDVGGGIPATGQTGRAGGAVSVTGGDVRVAAITTDGAAAATGNGGNAGTITLNATDATPVITLAGDLSARGGDAAGGTGGTGANITLPDPVRLDADVTIDVRGGAGGAPAARNVNFQSTVDAVSATPRALVVNAAGTTTFGGAVGGTNALASLTTDAGGTTAINGGAVTTAGAQTYNDAVTMGAATTFTSTGSGNVTFNSTVNSAGASRAVTVNTAGTTTFGAAVGGTLALASLTTDAAGTTAINGGSVRTTGAQTYNDAVTTSGATTLTATAGGNITAVNAANDFTGNLVLSTTGAANIVDSNALALGASSIGTLTAQTLTGDVTLNGAITASGGGDSIVLASGGNFGNNVGPAALNPGAGRWLVYSTDPALDNRNGLVYDFKQYNATYGVTPVAGAGRGFLYSVAPTIATTLTGTAVKTYDGTVVAPIGGLSLSGGAGAIDGDSVSLALTGASYDTKHVGTGKLVTATGVTVTASNGGRPVYGYQAAPASANVGTIDPAPLTVTAQPDTRVYDGTANSAVAPAVTGTLYDPIGTAPTQSFDTRHVGAGKTLTASGLVMNDGNGGANYSISYVSNTSGVITPAPLTVTAQTDSRVYDGTTNSSVAPVVTGTLYDPIGTAPTQSYDTKNVGTGKTLTANGLVMNDGNGGNNYAIAYVADNTGVITAAPLTITADDKARLYGDANPPLTASFAGLVPGDTPADIVGLTITTPAVPASNAGVYAITPAGGVNANYAITYVNGQLTINPAPLAITADDASRMYGFPNPAFTATATGFKLGQGFGDLSGSLAFSTPATITSPVGVYPITPSGVSSPNYAITFVDGQLVVGQGIPPADQAFITAVERSEATGEPWATSPGMRGTDCLALERVGVRRVLRRCY